MADFKHFPRLAVLLLVLCLAEGLLSDEGFWVGLGHGVVLIAFYGLFIGGWVALERQRNERANPDAGTLNRHGRANRDP